MLSCLCPRCPHDVCTQPGDVQMHSYQNGTSEPVKRDNWDQVSK